jgi:hypothetical protein
MLATKTEIPRISYPILKKSQGEDRKHDVDISLQSLDLGLVRYHQNRECCLRFPNQTTLSIQLQRLASHIQVVFHRRLHKIT